MRTNEILSLLAPHTLSHLGLWFLTVCRLSQLSQKASKVAKEASSAPQNHPRRHAQQAKQHLDGNHTALSVLDRTTPTLTCRRRHSHYPPLYLHVQAAQGFIAAATSKAASILLPRSTPSSSSASALLPSKLAMASSTSSSGGKSSGGSKGVQVYMDIKIGPRFAGRMVFEVRPKSCLSLPSLHPSLSSLPLLHLCSASGRLSVRAGKFM